MGHRGCAGIMYIGCNTDGGGGLVGCKARVRYLVFKPQIWKLRIHIMLIGLALCFLCSGIDAPQTKPYIPIIPTISRILAQYSIKFLCKLCIWVSV